MELRRYPRTACNAEGLLWVGGRFHPRRPLKVRVLDLSETGARIALPAGARLAPGRRLRLSWRLPPGVAGAGRRCSIGASVRRVSAPGEDPAAGLAFDRPVREQLVVNADWPRKVLALMMAGLLGALIVWIKVDNYRWFWHGPVLHAYSLIASGYVGLRLILSLFYKLPPDNGYMPKVSICITAKNEEACIAQTIDSCFASVYPKDRLEVIAVDDGSDDRTWERMKACEEKHPGLKAVRFTKNLGKRFAMAAGAVRAKGEYLIYVDSDTFLEPDGLYRIVQPFTDPQIGAVAGHILVDLEDNFLSKMESVRYYASHRVNKAGESVFGSVTCCSGAFSAYRKVAVLEVLQPWLNQRFLGVRSTFGDDRSLTNYILKRRRVVFHHGARSSTKVPDKWMKFFRQQLRWKKSWTRETLVAVRFMWKEHPVAALAYYLSVLLTLVSPIVVVNSTILQPLMMEGSSWHYIGGLALTYLFLCMVCLYHTRTRYWAYGLGFAGLYVAVLCWQTYYAMMTVNKTKWGTR